VISQFGYVRKQRRKLWVVAALALLIATVAVICVRPRRLEAAAGLHTMGASLFRRNESSEVGRDTKDAKNFEVQAVSIPEKRPPKSMPENHSTLPLPSGIDESVVGQAFQISASVRDGCVGENIECPLVMASVAKMVSEPRDIEWAARMEEILQAAADKAGYGKFSIRNVECRASICILEIAVRVHETFPRFEPFISSVLRANGAAIGLAESDPSNQRYVVELMDFSRR
jgi:hypothetical protein